MLKPRVPGACSWAVGLSTFGGGGDDASVEELTPCVSASAGTRGVGKVSCCPGNIPARQIV